MCRRTVELHEKFCFTCSCKRCALERSPRPCSNTDGTVHHMPSPPAWFLSAMAPAELPDDAPAKDVGRAMSLIRTTLAELLEQAHELFIEEGRAAEAWAVLEAGLFKAILLPHISVHLHAPAFRLQACLVVMALLEQYMHACAARAAHVCYVAMQGAIMTQ